MKNHAMGLAILSEVDCRPVLCDCEKQLTDDLDGVLGPGTGLQDVGVLRRMRTMSGAEKAFFGIKASLSLLSLSFS